MKTRAFNIALPQELVQKIDEAARKEYRNRSEFIREAVLFRLQDLKSWERIFQAGKQAGKKLRIKSEADVDKIVYAYRHGRKSKKGRN
ncbi:MAG: ribbon-helix-helix protein, CopG family [Candidatus Doudnabacteria bacterium]|nr:ribbon-helix-helix protein, CopG family [Candidatus Doudnabacteria bacterium]